MDLAIRPRRLTADERDRNDEQEQALYDEMYAELEAQAREEHDRHFGPGVPYTPNSTAIHDQVTRRIRNIAAQRYAQ